MAVPPIPLLNGDIVEMRVSQTLAGQRLLNVFHWRADVTSTYNFASFVTAFDAFQKTTSGTLYQLCYAQAFDCVQDFVDYQIISPGRYVAANRLGLGDGKQAGAANKSLPPNVACTMNRTAQRAIRGRHSVTHIGGIPTAFVENGKPNDEYLEILGQLGTVSTVPVPLAGGVTMQPIIFHRATPALSLDIIDFRLGQETRVMRRRTVGLGQ